MSDLEYPADLYELLHRGTPGDLELYVGQCEGATRILELGCGYGRVLEQLAAPGRRLVGLEAHPGLLARARARLGARAEIVSGDMRDFSLPETFERVLIPYCGLYCLVSDDDVQACLRGAYAHLEPGGRLVLDGYVGEAFEDLEPLDDDEEMVTEVVTIDDGARLWRVFESSTYDARAQRLEVTYVHVPDDGGPERIGRIPQRFLTEGQLRAHLSAAGFEVSWLGAGFEPGTPYDPEGDVWAAVAWRRP